jgi:Mor family transcriptional regulator
LEKDEVYEELKDIVGPEAAKRMVESYAGTNIYYPKRIVKKLRNQQIRKDFKDGASYLELTLRYGLSERHVRRIVSKE